MFERGFYNCERCGWSGSALRYAGYGTLVSGEVVCYDKDAGGQGICPQCGQVFRGCFHPDVYEQMVAASAQSKECRRE
jgi:hypothetical protein